MASEPRAINAMNDRTSNKSGGPYIGRPLPRFEDLRLVRGLGRYTDDLPFPGAAYAAFVRSPHPHARILRIDATAARAHPGVLAVLTGDDYVADGYVGVSHRPNPADAVDHSKPAYPKLKLDQPHLPLAVGQARHLGEAVAMVVAESALAARDAAEAVVVEYEPLPAVADVLDALAPGAPTLWAAVPDNIGADAEFGDSAAVRAAFERADVIVAGSFRNQRVVNAQMEPRSAIGLYDAAQDLLTLVSGNQGVHHIRSTLAQCFKLLPDRIRVICPDVGGGFGPRTNAYPEQVAVLFAARRLGRPVRWTSDRSEAFLTDYQGRDFVTEAKLALDRSGRMLAIAIDHIGNVGAQTVTYVPYSNASRIAGTLYDIPAAHVRVRGVMTNTVSTSPYRGAGRPEATLTIERLIDLAATKLGIDRLELRRRNMIRREQFPYRTAVGLTYDAGDFTGNMARAIAMADWAGFPARRRAAARRGRLAGIGLANYIESPVGMPHERVGITVQADGIVEVRVGTQAIGQGHETTYAQVMADLLGVPIESIRIVQGDSARIASGGGSHSVRSMRLAGTLMVQTANEVIARARRAAAEMLEVNESDVEFHDGLFATTNSNRRLSVFDVAQRAPLAAEAAFTGRIPAFPTGAAVCELEVDPETGAIEIIRYVTVDDVGQPINPLILHGQVHGGIVQGLGQALVEGVMYAPQSGQMLTGSFMDYGMPRADMLPSFDAALTEDPTGGNPLRIKGAGESGITPSLAAAMNALADALSPLGVGEIAMPATPFRVWQAIQAAR